MTRRITCYVVFLSLIWGAHTVDEEKVRNVFKSNMTRNDFSNLLQSLIKLNENRVSVLQKLYRLQDYGVLSEVLRSGEKKTSNGNRNNLFLIYMSKNPNDPSQRKVDFQVVNSVTSLDAGNDKIHPKLDFVLDPAGYVSQNIRKENRLESIFGNAPRPTRKHRADDESKKITTTTKTLKYDKPGLRTEVKHVKAKTSLKANEDRQHHTEHKRFEIVSNRGRRPTASEKLLDYDGNSNKYPQTVGYNCQSNDCLDFPIENDKLTTKPIIIKHILSSNHKNSKYSLEGKDENHKNSKYPLEGKETVGYYEYLDFTIENNKLTTKPIIKKHILSSNHKKSKYPIEGKGELDEDDYGSLFSNNKNDHKSSYISNKKLQGNNHHNPLTNKYTPTVKVQSNQQNNKVTTEHKKQIKHILSSNHKTSKYPLEGKDELDEDDYGSPFSNNKNDHKSPYISNKKLYGDNHHNSDLKNQQNNKLVTKPIIIKHIFSSNHKKSKYPLEGELDEDDYVSPFSKIENDHNSQHTIMDSDITIKKFHVNNHHNSKTNKNKPNLKIQRNQQNDNRNTKPTIKDNFSSNRQNTKYPLESKYERDEDYYGSPFSNIENYHNSQYTNINSDVSIKKLHGVNNHYNPKSNKNTPKVKVQSNQPPKLNQYNSNLNNQGIKYSEIKRPLDIEITTRKKYYKINGTDNSIKNSNLINANKHDLIYNKIKHIYVNKEIDNNNNKFLTTARENVYGSKPVIPETTKDRQYGSYPGFEDHKDVRDNSNKDKLKTAVDTPYGNVHGFEHYKNVMYNLNKDKKNTAKELHYGDNLNAESKKDMDYDGVKMFGNGKKSGEKFTVLITSVGNGTAEEVEQQNYPKLILNAFDQPEGKPILRKPFVKCLNKKALKLCSKSCISAYKNVCRRLKCSSRSKRALKTECKRSCKKTFESSSSKYSDENSYEYSDESYSDYDYS